MGNYTIYFTFNNFKLIAFVEQLCVMIRLKRFRDASKRPLFEVVFANWNEFMEVIKNPHQSSSLITAIQHADCLIGGIDMSIPYL